MISDKAKRGFASVPRARILFWVKSHTDLDSPGSHPALHHWTPSWLWSLSSPLIAILSKSFFPFYGSKITRDTNHRKSWSSAFSPLAALYRAAKAHPEVPSLERAEQKQRSDKKVTNKGCKHEKSWKPAVLQPEYSKSSVKFGKLAKSLKSQI